MNKLYTAGAFAAALAYAEESETDTDEVRTTTEIQTAAQQMRVELQKVQDTAQARRAELASGTDRTALSEEECEELKQKAE